jgi:cyclic beta-1,2-glucan synthetase
MHVGPGARSPAPWCNVLSNERFGSVVSEQGLGFTWAQSSQRSRLTPWSNDAVEEPSGEAVYLRDDSDGSLWSATPAPASPSAEFKVRHGQGYTIFAHSQSGLDQELTVFVSPQDPVKLLQLRIKNRSGRKRNLSCFALVEWVLGPSRHATRLHVSSSWDAERSLLLANNPLGSAPEAHAFLACSAEVASHTGDREELFGVGGSRSRPPALRRKSLSGRTGVGYDPAGALQVELELDPGQTRELCFVLGQGGNLAEAQLLAGRYVAPSTVARTFESLGQVWDAVCAITAHTPDPAFDILLNRWLAYQVLAARFWGRTGFYQSSGAYGFRDQLQDVLALVHARPELTREHLLRAAARQFKEGDVQHWWHPETGEGVRTRCSDDLLFLPYAVAAYVRATGDTKVLDEQLPFLEERALGEQDDDLFSAPQHAPGTASLYEHCVRALARGTTHGEHGLPLMGSGDWNDGMNRVGHAGRGESIWLGWFLARSLDDFAPLATARGESERAAAYRAESERLRQALDNSWDGAWYRRAYYDDGTPIGSHLSPECRIDAIAQSWSVLAGGDKGKARRAVESSLSELVDEDARLMRLLTPPFASTEPDPGYIRSYPPGIRENGGQYTHGVLWTIQALCALGEGERAHWLFSLLNPITHASNPVETKRYCVEPYVVAADVYASPQHMGRGGWTWYTGAAAWMYRIGVEGLLGLTRRGEMLDVAPCVPPSWREFSVTYRYGRSELSLTFQNPRGVATGVTRIELDERVLDGASISLVDDGLKHRAVVTLGAAHESESTPRNPPQLAGRPSSP